MTKAYKGSTSNAPNLLIQFIPKVEAEYMIPLPLSLMAFLARIKISSFVSSGGVVAASMFVLFGVLIGASSFSSGGFGFGLHC